MHIRVKISDRASRWQLKVLDFYNLWMGLFYLEIFNILTIIRKIFIIIIISDDITNKGADSESKNKK